MLKSMLLAKIRKPGMGLVGGTSASQSEAMLEILDML